MIFSVEMKILTLPGAGKYVELKHSYAIGRNAKWKIVCQFLKTLNIHPIYDPAIPRLEKRKYTSIRRLVYKCL